MTATGVIWLVVTAVVAIAIIAVGILGKSGTKSEGEVSKKKWFSGYFFKVTAGIILGGVAVAYMVVATIYGQKPITISSGSSSTSQSPSGAMSERKGDLPHASVSGGCRPEVKETEGGLDIIFPTCYEGVWEYEIGTNWNCTPADSEVVWLFAKGGKSGRKSQHVPVKGIYAEVTDDFYYPVKEELPFALLMTTKTESGKIVIQWNLRTKKNPTFFWKNQRDSVKIHCSARL